MTDKAKLEEIKKLADAMYYAAQYLTTDASRLHKAMDEYHKFIIHECKEESVSEELDDAANDYGVNIRKGYPRVMDETDRYICNAFKAGANWQKEQMMAKSIEAVVSQVPCSNEIILYNPSSVDKYYLPQEMNKLGLNKGDKVKLIIIKED